MAEEPLSARAESLWQAEWLVEARAIAVRYRNWLLSAALFISAFLVYRTFLGAPDTVYNNFVFLADAFLHGRIDIVPDREYIEFIHREGKNYVIPPPWPAFVVLPGVMIWGLAVNQTLVSAVIGSITASFVPAVTRTVREKFTDQVWLAVLFVFGTVFWYTAANGGVWFFSHTVAVLFLLFAIYFTLGKRSPFMAGLCLGAAFWTRAPTILSGGFFVIMLADLWLRPRSDERKTLVQRFNPRPLLEFAAGLGIFVLASFVYNYIRFDTPLDASQHNLPPQDLAQRPLFEHGPFDFRYYTRHVDTMLARPPVLSTSAPYVLPGMAGMALWAATPAFFYAFFAGVRDKRVIALGIGLIVFVVSIIAFNATAAVGWWITDPVERVDIPSNFHLYAFLVLTLIALGAALWALWKPPHDRLLIACWVGIIPVVLMLWTFAGTGFAQFDYRFALDFMPFLFLLTIRGMGDELRWHQKALILLSVAINLWAVLWVYEFEAKGYLDLKWTGW